MPTESPDIPPNMQKVLRRFERWRSAHTGRLPIPRRLWTAAVKLAREHGVFHTAKALRLEYGKLQQLLEATGVVKRPGARKAMVKSRHARSVAAPAFMELLAWPTAAAMIGLLKYGSGVPFYRLEGLEGSLGVPLPASTQ